MSDPNSASPEEAMADRFVAEIFRVWIRPELERRLRLGIDAPLEGDVRKALIVFKHPLGPTVTLNDEVGLIGKAIAGRDVVAGQEVSIADIHDIVWVEPPRLEGKPACYVLMFLRPSPHIAFNFVPNSQEVTEQEWRQEGYTLARFFAITEFEGSLGRLAEINHLLLPYGWWVMQAAIPDPIREATKLAVAKARPQALDDCFLAHFTPDRVESLTNEWSQLEEFQARRRVIAEATASFREGRYAVSIPALMPLLEGILQTWLLARVEKVPAAVKDKASLLGERHGELEAGLITQRSLRALLDAWEALGFYERFEWTPGSNVRLSRHEVLHGKDVDYATAANNLRVLLLLDSLFRQLKYRS
jgi:hypothetical protein